MAIIDRLQDDVNKLQSASDSEAGAIVRDDINDAFDSHNSLCRFLIMSINRSQDYVKASNNIALTPAIETCDIREVLRVAHKCIASQQYARVINIKPLVRVELLYILFIL